MKGDRSGTLIFEFEFVQPCKEYCASTGTLAVVSCINSNVYQSENKKGQKKEKEGKGIGR